MARIVEPPTPRLPDLGEGAFSLVAVYRLAVATKTPLEVAYHPDAEGDGVTIVSVQWGDYHTTGTWSEILTRIKERCGAPVAKFEAKHD